MNFAAITDSIASVLSPPDECPRCRTAARIQGGECLSCLLLAGTTTEGAGDDTATFEAVLREIDVRDTDWRLGNYQILEEVGRGGMGLIYRARQRHSKRIVALKRVLRYHADSRETLERFAREAEAAASLDHPNILPIYEVGEAEGLPFFTMKYATGGTLHAAAPALRNNPRECVRLLAKVARAVAYGHREGILHRDLKPGNILLDGRGEPFVSDFGLAKWIDADSDLTRTLAIFGTPGFIAPEQAIGERGKLTAAADVYSLGAILFDLLAGRPAFLGEHALAVIRQAADKPAPKLRSLVRTADRDLETICAKCLEREPQARYRSAATLAEDLERWLEGRPIAARPVSLIVQGWRGAKRNPRLAGSIAACVILAGIGIAGWAASSRFEAVVLRAEAARKSVAVGSIEDLDAIANGSKLSTALTAAIEAQLAETKDVALQPFPAGAREHQIASNADGWKAIGRAAKARLIVSGSVRERLGRYRVALHLIETSTGNVVSTSLHDVESVTQAGADIVPLITQRLQTTEGALQKAPTSGGTTNPEARSYYERAKELYFRFNVPDLYRAIESTRQALEFDPEYGQAYALLANACQLRARLAPDADWLNEAERAASAALRIAPGLPEAHRALAGTSNRRGRMREALDSYLTAYELEPGSGRTASMLGNIYDTLGRADLAVWWLERAMALEGRPIYTDSVAAALTSLGELEAAEKLYHSSAIFRPDLPVRQLGLARIALMRGDLAAARAECAAARASFPKNPEPIIMAGLVEFFGRNFSVAEQLYREASAFGRTGGVELHGAVGIISAIGFISSEFDAAAGRALLSEALALDEKKLGEAPDNLRQLYSVAANRAALGERDQAVAALDRAIAAGWSDHYSLAADPRFDCVRETPAFAAQLARARQKMEERAQQRRERQRTAAK